MTVSEDITKYVENSKIKGCLSRWDKSEIFVYITPITANIPNKEFYYSEIKRAADIWNKTLFNSGIKVKYVFVTTPQTADVVIHWTKVGRVFEGMCKYLSVVGNQLRKVSVEVGLYNEYSGKNTTDESIFFVMMHEFGHALGLGHGIEVDDVMYVPHQKNVSIPSENDIYVLKLIYAI